MVTCQLQEKEDSIGHPLNTTDPLKFNDTGKQKVNIIPLIRHARTSATVVSPNKANLQIIDNYGLSRSPRHIIKFQSFSSLVIKVYKFIIQLFPQGWSNCYAMMFITLSAQHKLLHVLHYLRVWLCYSFIIPNKIPIRRT
jgi:hypothetical protein